MFCHRFVAKSREVLQISQEMVVKGCRSCEMLHNVAHNASGSNTFATGRSVMVLVVRCAQMSDILHPTVSPGLHAASNFENEPTLNQL